MPVLVLVSVERAPDILVADGSQAIAVGHKGELMLISGRNNTFATNVWSERYRGDIIDRRDLATCGALGCIVHSSEGFTLALALDRGAFYEDCVIADIVVTRLWAPGICRATGALVIDQTEIGRLGTHALDWNGPDTPPAIRTGIDTPNRPWRP